VIGKTNNEIKKVLILGIDAIEYDLVEEWDLKNLKQKEYGKTILPLYPGQEPATVIIWPCFITGKEPEEMGYSTVYVFSKPLQFFINILSPIIRKIFIDTKAEERTEKIHGKQSILDKYADLVRKFGLSHKPKRDDIKAKTIFENKNFKSIHLHIPVYDKDDFPEYRKDIIKVIAEKAYQPVIEMKQKKEFKQRSKEVFEIIEKGNWDIFMQYFFLLDSVQHIYYKNPKKIAEFYLMFDELVEKVSKKIDKNTLLLIVSDHGQKKGIHTPYGFYSSNKKLNLKNPKLIDFKQIIENEIEKS
jgi:predicted AlkP superfamily phosphohydrolase/phosphomutase